MYLTTDKGKGYPSLKEFTSLISMPLTIGSLWCLHAINILIIMKCRSSMYFFDYPFSSKVTDPALHHPEGGDPGWTRHAPAGVTDSQQVRRRRGQGGTQLCREVRGLQTEPNVSLFHEISTSFSWIINSWFTPFPHRMGVENVKVPLGIIGEKSNELMQLPNHPGEMVGALQSLCYSLYCHTPCCEWGFTLVRIRLNFSINPRKLYWYFKRSFSNRSEALHLG